MVQDRLGFLSLVVVVRSLRLFAGGFLRDTLSLEIVFFQYEGECECRPDPEDDSEMMVWRETVCVVLGVTEWSEDVR